MSSPQQKYSNLQMGITFNQEFLWRFFLIFVSNESIDLSVVSAVNDKVLKWQAMQIKGLYSLSCGDHQSLSCCWIAPAGSWSPELGECVCVQVCVSPCWVSVCEYFHMCLWGWECMFVSGLRLHLSQNISPPHSLPVAGAPACWCPSLLVPPPAGAPACWCTDGSRCSGVYWLTLGCCLLTFYALLALYAAQ